MTKNASIYFFDPGRSCYDMPDTTCRYLTFSQKMSLATREIFGQIKQSTKLQVLSGTFLIVGTANGILAKWIIDKISGEEDKEVNYCPYIAFSMLSSTIAMSAVAYNRFFRHLEYSTCYFSQDSQYNLITPQIGNAFNELRHEHHYLVNLWLKIKNFETEDKRWSFLKTEIEEGICFGYAMAILEQLSKGKNLHGTELLCKLNIKIAIKKQLLEHFHTTFRALLRENDEIISEGEDCSFIMKGTGKTIRVGQGEELAYSIIEDAADQVHRLRYRIPGAFRINTSGQRVQISEGVDCLKRCFLKQISLYSFLEFDQIKSDEYPNSSLHFVPIADFISNASIPNLHPALANVARLKKAQDDREEFIRSHLFPFSQETIIAGVIGMNFKENKNMSRHALYFRLSNNKYHLFDPSMGFYELPTFDMFFHKLHPYVEDKYGLNTQLRFCIMAIKPFS